MVNKMESIIIENLLKPVTVNLHNLFDDCEIKLEKHNKKVKKHEHDKPRA
jgi:hypothetical protein